MQDTMRTWVYEGYGKPEEVAELREVDLPEIGDDQVLVRVKAASVNPLDWHMMTGEPLFLRLVEGLRRPRRNRPGADVAGTVDAVGKAISRFKPGDEVFGQSAGTFAEFVAVSEAGLVHKPAASNFEEAAAVPVAGLTALQGLRDWGRLRSGDRVLINGASGGVGTFAVQIAKALGAEVTGVCSAHNVEQTKDIGADRVIDYTREDFVESGGEYDVLFDVPGNRSLAECRSVLKPGGTYVLVGGSKGRWVGPLPRLAGMNLRSVFTDMKTGNGVAERRLDDLQTLRAMLESGEIKPVIDRNYKLDELVEALDYQGTFHARAKIVLTV